MLPLVAVILWLGIYPAPVLRRMETSAAQFVTDVTGAPAESVAAVGAP